MKNIMFVVLFMCIGGILYAQQNTIHILGSNQSTISQHEKNLIEQFINNSQNIDNITSTNVESIKILNYDSLISQKIIENSTSIDTIKALVFKRIKENTIIPSLDLSTFTQLSYIILEANSELNQDQIHAILSNVTIPSDVKIVLKHIYVN